MPAEFDDLNRRLSGLESDVARVRMAGSAAARRRGRARTRNRAVAVVAGSAAAVAAGVGTLNALPLGTPATPEPVDTPTVTVPDPTPSQTPEPTPEPEVTEPDDPDTNTPEPDVTSPDPEGAFDPFLRDDEVNPIGSYEELQRADTITVPIVYETFCLPELVYEHAEGQPWSEPVQVGGEAPTIYQAEWFGFLDGTFFETVAQFPFADDAAGFVAGYAELPEQCGEVVETHEQEVHQPAPVGVSGADEALVWTVDERVLPDDPGSEGSFHGAGVARAGSVVVVIGFAAMGDPTAGTDATWQDHATAILASALERATASG